MNKIIINQNNNKHHNLKPGCIFNDKNTTFTYYYILKIPYGCFDNDKFINDVFLLIELGNNDQKLINIYNSLDEIADDYDIEEIFYDSEITINLK